MYKLGCYDENGEQECLRTAKTKEEAKEKYKLLHEKYGCTIWIQKVEFVKPEEFIRISRLSDYKQALGSKRSH